jgi:hypothetical protein
MICKWNMEVKLAYESKRVSWFVYEMCTLFKKLANFTYMPLNYEIMPERMTVLLHVVVDVL